MGGMKWKDKNDAFYFQVGLKHQTPATSTETHYLVCLIDIYEGMD